MLRLLKVIIALIGVMSALILLARVVAPPDVYGFPLSTINLTADCQLPCWHGITPGVTTRAEALAIFDAGPAYLFVEGNDKKILHERYKDVLSKNNSTLIFNEEDVLTRIELFGSDTMYHVTAKLGKPLGIAGITCMVIGYRHFSVEETRNVSFPSNGRILTELNPDSPTNIIIAIGEIASHDYIQSPWRGFRLHYFFNQDPLYCF